MPEPVKILIVDDDPGNADYVARILAQYNPDIETDAEKALEKFKETKYDILISDQKMPVISGLDLIKACNDVSDDFIGLLISAYTDSEDLIDAVNSNIIYKYIIKPFLPDILLQHVHRAHESLVLRREKAVLEQKLLHENQQMKIEIKTLKTFEEAHALNSLKGSSRSMLCLKEQIKTYSNSDSTVLITGETGTGKEIVAQAIHELSRRSGEQYIKINCTTLSSNLLESELFGHEKGAFTGALQYKKGFFESADNGTIFLDEIGDLPLDIQPKLLRILQFGTYYPIGSRQEKYTNMRIIAATNMELEQKVSDGTFREDLYHRLNRLRILTPSLREHPSDIPEIFRHIYLKENSGIIPSLTQDAVDFLSAYSFPGNVRELETYVYRLLLINPNNEPINEVMLMQILNTEKKSFLKNKNSSLKDEVANLEKSEIITCLEKNNFNITRTARTLKLSRPGLHNKMKRYGIEKDYN